MSITITQIGGPTVGITSTVGPAINVALPGSISGPRGPQGPDGSGTGVSLTLNWAGGIAVDPGTYVLIATAAYPFTITSLDASIGSAGGAITATVRNAGVPVAGLDGIVITQPEKTNFPASGAAAVVALGATVDVVLIVSDVPTDTFLALNGTKT